MSSRSRLQLVCYNDNHGYGWRHVDLFVHDDNNTEQSWVHWQVEADGPDAADRVTGAVEPTLRRISPWRHGVSAGGVDYWTAEVEWAEVV